VSLYTSGAPLTSGSAACKVERRCARRICPEAAVFPLLPSSRWGHMQVVFELLDARTEPLVSIIVIVRDARDGVFRNETKFGLRLGLQNDLSKPALPFRWRIADFPENADELPPRDLRGQTGPYVGLKHALPSELKAMPRDERSTETCGRSQSFRGRRKSHGVLQPRMDIWCGWDPEESDFGDTAQNVSSSDAICTTRKVVAALQRLIARKISKMRRR
jgi:hypothetical protein